MIKKRKKFLFVILVFISLNFISGASLVNFDFDISENKTLEMTKGPFESSSVIFQVITSEKTEDCKYGTSKTNIANSFEENYDNKYKKTFTNLGEGTHTYYVECLGEKVSENSLLKANFIIDKPVSASISLSEDPPLKKGKYEITLVTSENVEETPSLEYSFDGLVYKPVPLYGSGKVWKGYFIISESIGESIVSFKFSAKDLEGREGTLLTGDSVFMIDTKEPEAISTISSISYEGQIKLRWHYEEKEDIEEFRIYRSEEPGVDYTDYYDYAREDRDYFTDNAVERGETYYYRLCPVDKAGNIADLSREIKVTALLDNDTEEQGGLSLDLRGDVDNFIIEIESVIDTAESIKTSFVDKEGNEEELLEKLRLNKEIDSSINELNSLKRDVDSYKSQDLSEAELESKLDSSSARLSVIKKKIPENIVILNQRETENKIKEEDFQTSVLEYNSSLSENYLNDYIEQSKKISERFSSKNKMYFLEILYLDGSKREITFFENKIDSDFAPSSNSSFILTIPKEISEDFSDIKMLNLNYDVIKSDPVVGFDIDTKSINYYVEKEVDSESLENIVLLAIQKPETKNFPITGNFLLEIPSNNYFIGVTLISIFSALFVYLFYMKKSNSSELIEINKAIEKIKKLLEDGKKKEAKEVYKLIKKIYQEMPYNEKKYIYPKINSLFAES